MRYCIDLECEIIHSPEPLKQTDLQLFSPEVNGTIITVPVSKTEQFNWNVNDGAVADKVHSSCLWKPVKVEC